LKATAVHEEEVEEERDEWDLALVTSADHALFSKQEVLLDNEASISVFQNYSFKESRQGRFARRHSARSSGGQSNGARTISRCGNCLLQRSDIMASANILSFASQVDAGADITYDKVNDRFTMIPVKGKSTYHFGRKDVTGSQGRFYVCDTRTMIDKNEAAHVATVEDNMKCYTKREIEQARKARELLVRMGFPSVQQAIRAVSSRSNFDVTSREFEVSDAIWGKDVASLKGKTKKKSSPVADININPTLARQDQVLSDRGGNAPRSNPRDKPILT
jgi:hypothetical protein